MTSSVKVQSHNYPVLVRTLDRDPIQTEPDSAPPQGNYRITREDILRPEDGEKMYHCTTTRVITVTDLEYDDPRAQRPAV